METTFTAFSDLPSIVEDQPSGIQMHSFDQLYPQERYMPRVFQGYEHESSLAVDTRRYQAFPTNIGFGNVPYAPVWHDPYPKTNPWSQPYAYQPVKTESPLPWTAPLNHTPHVPTSASFSDSTSSNGDSYPGAHMLTPDSGRYESSGYPTPPGGSPVFWQYQNKSCGGYNKDRTSASPTCSHLSLTHETSKTDALNGIKLEDVQGYPDACPADQFNDFTSKQTEQAYTWEPNEYPRTITDDVTIDRRSEEAARSPSADAILEDTATEYDNDSASDYAPKARALRTTGRVNKAARTPKSGIKNRPKMKTRSRPSRTSKHTPTKEAAAAEVMLALRSGKNVCPHCAQTCNSKNALNKHITTAHTRPFTCTFRKYGCTATFGSKNEWKRHVSSQHLRLGIWRCDLGACYPQTTGDEEELIFNDFNRKDLFTQHLRRMHAPTNSSTDDKAAFNATLDEHTSRCLLDIRNPPPQSTCGYCAAEGQEQIFDGPGSWETRMEHVGRHLESGHGEEREWLEDMGLRTWMIMEGLLEGNDVQGYWLTGPAYVHARKG